MQLTDIFARSRFVFLDGGMGTMLGAALGAVFMEALTNYLGGVNN